MRTATLLLAALVLAVAGCGADEEENPTDFPAVEVGTDGIARAEAKDNSEAKRLCDAAQADWPAAWGEHPYVTFDLPDPASDFSCVKPAGG